ncbi:MAG: recombinase family protein [Bacteroidota bacterium]|nr:recombinase family protein [Bacteroidota bacterium]
MDDLLQQRRMKMNKAVIYVRCSTQRQAKSGLGLEDQRERCLSFCKERGVEVIGIYVDEGVSGKVEPDKRPYLSQALQVARQEGAKIVVAKLDRLSREVHCVAGLMKHQVDFVVVEHPEAPSFLLHILASMNQFEREQISKRTKDALAVAKQRGVKLGGSNPVIRNAVKKQSIETIAKYRPILMECYNNKELTYRGKPSMTKIAKHLTEIGIETPRGKTTWSSQQIKQLFAKFEDNPFKGGES